MKNIETEIVIREAKIKEISDLVDLNSYLFYLSKKKFDSTMNPEWQEGRDVVNYFSGRVGKQDGVVFVAEYNGELIGYAAGYLKYPAKHRKQFKQTELENLMVTQKYHGQGIGKQLWDVFIEWSKKNKAENIVVSVYAKNTDGIDFYKSLGFKEYDLHLELDITKK
jgi:ribosomal protein S18 acetylase RimI-like enzyme